MSITISVCDLYPLGFFRVGKHVFDVFPAHSLLKLGHVSPPVLLTRSFRGLHEINA